MRLQEEKSFLTLIDQNGVRNCIGEGEWADNHERCLEYREFKN
jgi:hypothetical protein